jgi:hypothetical protein
MPDAGWWLKGDPNRLAMFSWSSDGYAALQLVRRRLRYTTSDINVRIYQSEMMDPTLTAAGVKHELVTFSGLDRRLVDSAASTEVLRRSDEFLRTALWPDVPREH